MFSSSTRTTLLLVGLLAASLNVAPADNPAPQRPLIPYAATPYLAQAPVAPVPQVVQSNMPSVPVVAAPKPVPQAVPSPVGPKAAATEANAGARRITLTLRDTPIAEVFDMLGRSERVSVVLGKGVTGNVSVSLFNVTHDQAVKTVAEAGGYVAERRGNAWLVMDRVDLGREMPSSETIVKTFKIQYSEAKLVAEIITKHLSRYGKVTPLIARNMLVVEDRPETVAKIAAILDEVDREPRQIMIEAKILQIDLTDEDQFGINWSRMFSVAGGGQSFGVRGYGIPTSGFFATVADGVQGTLAALSKRNQVRTLASPRLLAAEGQTAQVQIGGQRGYKVTTIVNLTATETIQFLDAGVILRVTPYVDDAGRIHMKIQPEVSDYDFVNGIPGKKTTTVNTSTIATSGETIFIGGLIRGRNAKDRQGVPGLSDIPVVGALFSYQTKTEEASETVVLITPYLVEENRTSRFQFTPDTQTRRFMDERENRLNLMQPPGSPAPDVPQWIEKPQVPVAPAPVSPLPAPIPATPPVLPAPASGRLQTPILPLSSDAVTQGPSSSATTTTLSRAALEAPPALNPGFPGMIASPPPGRAVAPASAQDSSIQTSPMNSVVEGVSTTQPQRGLLPSGTDGGSGSAAQIVSTTSTGLTQGIPPWRTSGDGVPLPPGGR